MKKLITCFACISMVFSQILYAQNADKITNPLPGLFENNQLFFDSRPATVSSDGRTIALTNYNGYAILDLDSMTFKMLMVENNGRISPDLSFIHKNQPDHDAVARSISSSGNSNKARWTSLIRGGLIRDPLREFKISQLNK